MQGAMSATQDEVASVVIFNILGNGGCDADDRLAGGPARPTHRNGRLDVAVQYCHLSVRRRPVTRNVGAVADSAGCERRAGDTASADDPVRYFSAAPAPHDQLDLRHGGSRRARHRTGTRRLPCRNIYLALGVLCAGPGRACLFHRAAPEHAARLAHVSPLNSTGSGF
jgi:hypothetical protein